MHDINHAHINSWMCCTPARQQTNKHTPTKGMRRDVIWTLEEAVISYWERACVTELFRQVRDSKQIKSPSSFISHESN